jgi:aklavinone 12-hydroxylase
MAERMSVLIVGAGLARRRAEPHQRAIELTLGFRYRSSVILTDDDPADTEDPYHPTARPGFPAPHAWLATGKSTTDLFGDEFVQLAGKPWQAEIPVHVIDNHEVLAKLGITQPAQR